MRPFHTFSLGARINALTENGGGCPHDTDRTRGAVHGRRTLIPMNVGIRREAPAENRLSPGWRNWRAVYIAGLEGRLFSKLRRAAHKSRTKLSSRHSQAPARCNFKAR